MLPTSLPRAFKTAWFSKAAKKYLLDDTELCTAFQEVLVGRADDLGGGIFKKRLNDNRQRAIILAKGGQYWVYAYLFSKQDRANITLAERASFGELAKAFAQKTAAQMAFQLQNGDLIEICHDC